MKKQPQSLPERRYAHPPPLDAETRARLDDARERIARQIAPQLAAIAAAEHVTAADLAVRLVSREP